jgi:hypothetical protein
VSMTGSSSTALASIPSHARDREVFGRDSMRLLRTLQAVEDEMRLAWQLNRESMDEASLADSVALTRFWEMDAFEQRAIFRALSRVRRVGRIHASPD